MKCLSFKQSNFTNRIDKSQKFACSQNPPHSLSMEKLKTEIWKILLSSETTPRWGGYRIWKTGRLHHKCNAGRLTTNVTDL